MRISTCTFNIEQIPQYNRGANCYDNVLQDIEDNKNFTLLLNQQIITDRKISANKPDVVFKNLKEKTFLLIAVAIPASRNLSKRKQKK